MLSNKETYLKLIGANIKQIRKEQSIEIKEAAHALGISVQAYGKIVNGMTDINISRLFDIASFFKIDYNKILQTNNHETYNYTSQNNSGGYNVLNKGVLNVTSDFLENYLKDDISIIKKKLDFFEAAMKK